MIRYLIIEHPTRGVLTDLEHDVVDGHPIAHFSWSKPRNDESTRKFFSINDLRSILIELKQWNPKVHSELHIRRSDDDWSELHTVGEARSFLGARR